MWRVFFLLAAAADDDDDADDDDEPIIISLIGWADEKARKNFSWSSNYLPQLSKPLDYLTYFTANKNVDFTKNKNFLKLPS